MFLDMENLMKDRLIKNFDPQEPLFSWDFIMRRISGPNNPFHQGQS